MADVYVFQAALLCADCGLAQCGVLTVHGERPADPEDESSYDSDDYPKGPYPDGGGESDSPQHCDQCGTFLHNPLTPDGYAYVRAQAEIAGAITPQAADLDEIDIEASAAKAQADWDATGRHGGDGDSDAPLAQWIRFYPEAWHSANMR